MSQEAIGRERRYLVLGAVGNLVIGVVALITAAIASSSAITLDGLFNLTYFLTALLSIKVASLVARADDDRFPYGYSAFEPLINLVKGLLVLTITVLAIIGAARSVIAGGRVIAAGWAVIYGVFASAVCWIAAVGMARGGRTTNSPIIRADAANWLVNAVISSCVLVAFAGAFVLQRLGASRWVPYIDPFVTLTVCVLGIAIPIRMSWKALMELLQRAPSDEVIAEVRGVVEENVRDIPTTHRHIRITQPGRTRLVLVHLVLPKGTKAPDIAEMDRIREKTLQGLMEKKPATILDIVFTANPRWGALVSLTKPLQSERFSTNR